MSQFYLQTYVNYYHPKIPNPVRTAFGTTLKLSHHMANQIFPQFSAVTLTHTMTAFLPVSFHHTYNALTASPLVPLHAKENLTLLPRHPPIFQSPPCSINEPPLLTTSLPQTFPLYQAHRTTSNEALCALTGITPIVIKAEEEAKIFNIMRGSNQNEIDKDENARDWLHPEELVRIIETQEEEIQIYIDGSKKRKWRRRGYSYLCQRENRGKTEVQTARQLLKQSGPEIGYS